MAITTCPPEDLTTVDDDGHLSESESVPVEPPEPERTTPLHDRKWPMLYMAGFVGIGLLYMFLWNPVVHHTSTWAIGGDVWGIDRGGQYVLWGDLGGIYNQGTGIIAFPGMSVLLVPVAFVSQHLNLSSSFGRFMLQRPSVGLVLMPVELLLGSSVIFAADALAQKVGVAGRRRIWMCAAVAIVAWPVAAVWGHAAGFPRHGLPSTQWWQSWTGGGLVWDGCSGSASYCSRSYCSCFPCCSSTHPQVSASCSPPARWCYRPFSSEWRLPVIRRTPTDRSVKQPTPPSVNHATPWVALSPRVNSNAIQTFHGASLHPLAPAAVTDSRSTWSPGLAAPWHMSPAAQVA